MKRGRISYSAAELAWIEARRHLARCDLHAAFVSEWARPDVSEDNIKSLCSRKGWSAGPDGKRGHLGQSALFSAAEMTWLRRNADLSRRDVGPAFRAAHGRTDVTDAQIVSWRKRNRVTTGRDGRYAKGNVPASAGKKGICAPGSEKGWFRKGHAPHNSRPIGYESVNSNGYVLICVDEPNPFRPDQPTHMAFKHIRLWVARNGPVPRGHALKCLDGNRQNCDPDNWVAVPRGLLPRLNGKSGRDYDRAPDEVKPAIMAIAQLEHAARKIRKGKA